MSTVDNAIVPTVAGHQSTLAPPEGRGAGPSLTEILAAMPDTPSRDQFVKQLVDAEISRQQFRQDWQLAYQFAMSGEFADLKNKSEKQAVAAAITKVQLGRSLGMSAIDSIRHIYFANGRPSVENEIVAAKLRDAGFDWDIEWHEETEQHKGKPWKRCTGCTLWLKVWSDKQQAYVPILNRNEEQVSYSFTEADADHAKIYIDGKQVPLSEKWNFKSWPREMYFWRAIARVHKYQANNVLRGAVARAEVWDVPLEQEIVNPTMPAEDIAAPEPPEPPPAKRSLKEQVLEQAKLLEGEPDK